MDDENILDTSSTRGALVEHGLMDARKQAKALLGLDSALRYFVAKRALTSET